MLVLKWSPDCVNSYLPAIKIPKIWRRALVVTILKPNNPPGDPKCYQPISLMCLPLQDPQASYLRPCQVHHRPTSPKGASWFLTWEINRRSSHFVDSRHRGELFGKKEGQWCVCWPHSSLWYCAVSPVSFCVCCQTGTWSKWSWSSSQTAASPLPLGEEHTAGYDASQQPMILCGLTSKLLCLLPDRHMVKMIMELVTNCSFTLTTGRGTHSRLRCLKNGVPQGSVLAPFYITSTPTACRHQCHRNMLMQMILLLCILAGRRRGS